ncbi:DUF4145 domain-containing protein [Pseudarthrobacter oxydans]|uniref:DUF4145 domain-containing protein n=1 Tax=Pseudarthrobacter oxydans TaxID=1671 RepID=UPI0037FB6D4F
MTRHGDATSNGLTLPSTSSIKIEAAFKCDNCRRLSIGSTIGIERDMTGAANSPNWWDARPITWTPHVIGGKEFADVPEHIASAADEAYKCRSINALRGSILLARGVVEATAKERGIDKGMLHAKIEALHAQGDIRGFTRDAAHELRFLGNDMAHGDFINDVDNDDADAVLDVMTEILSEVYQGPARVNRMKAKRQAKE